MKLRDKRFLKFEAMMALAAVVASLALTIVMDETIAMFCAALLIMIGDIFGSTSMPADFVTSLALDIVMDKPIATFLVQSLIMVAEFAFGSTLSWKLLGSDKQTCLWQTLSIWTTVFIAIFWVLVIALSALTCGFDAFFMFGLICTGLVVLVIFPLPIIMLATYLYCKFLHKGNGETAQGNKDILSQEEN